MSTTAEGMAAAAEPEDPLAEVAATLGLLIVDENQPRVVEGPVDEHQQLATNNDNNLDKSRLASVAAGDEDTAALSRSQTDLDASGERGGERRMETGSEDKHQQLQQQEEEDVLDALHRDIPHHICADNHPDDGVSTITGVPTEQDLYPSAFSLLRADEEHHQRQQHQQQQQMLQHSVQPLPSSCNSRAGPTNQKNETAAASLPTVTDDKTITKTLDGTLGKGGAGTAVFVPSSSKRSPTTTTTKSDSKEPRHDHSHRSSSNNSSSSSAYQALYELENTVTSKLPNVGIGVSMVTNSQIAHDIQEVEAMALNYISIAAQTQQAQGQPGAFAVGGGLLSGTDHNNNNNGGEEDSESDEENHVQIIPEDTATEREEDPEINVNHEEEPSSSLALARAVEEGQQSVPLLLPVAQPMEKSNHFLHDKRTSYVLLAILVSLVIVAVIVAATVNNSGISSDDNNRDSAGIMQDTAKEEARRRAIHARIAAALDKSSLASLPWGDDNDDNTFFGDSQLESRSEYRASSHSNSLLLLMEEDTLSGSNPYASALEWILDMDPMQLNATADNLLQRYYLVLFYFSTTADQEWNFCNPPSSANDSNPNCHYEALQSTLHGELLWGNSEGGGFHWTDAYVNYEEVLSVRWLSGQHECLWAGLVCENQKATHFHLGNMNLTGTIPPEVDILEDMQSISITYNSLLRGPFPAGIAGLKNLTYLDLQENQLTGSAMDVLMSRGSYGLENLRLLRLAFNPLDSWRIPSDMATVMPNLENFLCSGSSVTGSLPTEISELSNLRFLSLAGNSEITGPIPSELWTLTNLKELFLGMTQVSGVIPAEIAQLSRLEFVDLYNTLLTGTIPEELYLGDFNDLLMLDLGYNDLTGTLSTNIGQLWFMGFLYLSGNPNLVGTIPTEIGLLEGLQKLHIEGSGFTGTMPTELCDLTKKYFYKFNADCLEDPVTGEATMPCPDGCCTKCCDRATGYCEKL